MNKTNIDYLDYTWNPIAMRCTPVSEGCANCWHLKLCDMHVKNPKVPMAVRHAKAGDYVPFLDVNKLYEPRQVKKSSTIGVQFMGDLFHESIPLDDRKSVARIMGATKQHTFLVLTKRPENAVIVEPPPKTVPGNIWLGVSCENQEWADKRIPLLLKIPAAVRLLSLEPLLGPIDLWQKCERCGGYGVLPEHPDVVPSGEVDCYYCSGEGSWFPEGLNWVIVGCESGPKCRPCKLEWAKSIVEQCQAASVPVWVKQLSINGKVSHDMNEWPEELRIKERPE